jgi:hypothetical protein
MRLSSMIYDMYKIIRMSNSIYNTWSFLRSLNILEFKILSIPYDPNATWVKLFDKYHKKLYGRMWISHCIITIQWCIMKLFA